MIGFRIEVEFFVDHLEYSVSRGNEDVARDEKNLRDLINDNRAPRTITAVNW
jgi:hypothetical protein